MTIFVRHLKKYFSPIRYLLRKGTAEDPYIPIDEEKVVYWGQFALQEIPDITYKVRIPDMIEIPKEKYDPYKSLKKNEYYVDYSNGLVSVNQNLHGETLKVHYKGRGVIQIPAERIYLNSPNPWAVDNLQELIEFIFQKEKELQEALVKAIEIIKETAEEFKNYIDEFIKLATEKINDMDVHIELCRKQTELAKQATENADKATKESKEQTELAKKATDEAVEATNKAITTTQWTIEKTQETIEATNKAKEEIENIRIDRLNTRIIWKDSVPTYQDIETTYPFPEIGWATILDNAGDNTGDWYRYDGVKWQKIGKYVAGVGLATATNDGMLSAEDFVKLQTVQPNAEPNYHGEDAKMALPDYMRTRTIVYSIGGQRIEEGVQGKVINFPNKGRIIGVSAICKQTGTDYSKIQLEKISSEDYRLGTDNWIPIFKEESPIVFEYGEYIAGVGTLINREVNSEDIFRVNATKVAGGILGITIEIHIEI